jgi:peptide/nickel transport system permease protein
MKDMTKNINPEIASLEPSCIDELAVSQRSSLTRDALDRLMANKLAVVGLVLVLLLFFVAIFGPWLTPHDFLSQNISARNQPPSTTYFLGTDELGRDVFSRIIYGARTATIIAFFVTGLSLILGIFFGALSGYIGGWVDSLIVWFIDLTMSVPSLLLAVVISVSLRSPFLGFMEDQYLKTFNPIFRQTFWVDFVLVFGVLALVQWPGYARLIRGQVLSIRNKNYIMAARALGLPQNRIITRYIIPNVLGPVIVSVSAGLGTAMVLESAFSFLGIGVNPPIPSWGNMISNGLRVWHHSPHLLAAPAIVLGVMTIAFNFLGDGLNDAMNPRQWK